MDISSASDWSSGCESGWTLYFNESISQSPNHYQKINSQILHDHHTPNVDDEEDLSMISDASSGPPHFHYEDDKPDFCSYHSSEKSKKNKPKEHSFLDDTASSPALSYSNRCMNQSNNQASINHLYGLMGKSRQSTQARQQEPAEPSRSRGRRRG